MIRSMVADDVNHPGGCLLMNTGERVATRPSLGAWVTYGLGTENQNLPGFVAIGPGPLIEGARQYGAAFPAGRVPGDVRVRPAKPDPQPEERPGRARTASAGSSTPCGGSTSCTSRTAPTTAG